MAFETKNRQQESTWQHSLRAAIRDPRELFRLLELPEALLPGIPPNKAFPLRVPREFVARMRKGDPDDPLLRQVLPTTAEHAQAHGFVSDPLSEHALGHAGTLQKYPGRALLITTGACPVHCRYCFRREFPYAGQNAARESWGPALTALKNKVGISELILSGGDPLSLGNGQLERLLAQVQTDLPQISTIRIHTRFPVVLPARVDDGLIRLLESVSANLVTVLHTNHPAEIDASVGRAVQRLRAVSQAVLNQAVLLRRINDSADVLIELGRRLLDIGVLPYYLHLLDRVRGSAHFETDEATALRLIESVRCQAPGYLVPRLVREIAGELCKTPVNRDDSTRQM